MRFAIAVSVLLLCACTETPDLAPDSRFTGANGVALTAGQIDSTVERLMQAGDVPGLALALISDGEVAYVKAYGFADVDEGRALETDTVMYAASLTKAAFAYTVMTLVDDGVVDLDRLISDYLAVK